MDINCGRDIAYGPNANQEGDSCAWEDKALGPEEWAAPWTPH